MEDDDEEADVVALSSEGGAPRPPRRKGPMDKFFSSNPDEPGNKRYMQTTLESNFKKNERKKVAQYISRWI